MPCSYYPPADLDDLEELAESAQPEEQKIALETIAQIFNTNELAYALMGGMNFYLRGSGRTTDDVDLVVTGRQSLEATLDLLSGDDRITRPRNKMSWLGGVARVFVLVGKQQVQIDLKWQRGEGHGMPPDLNAATELIPIRAGGSPIRILALGPLVKAKFQSYGRGLERDFHDLRFVCTDQRYAAAVREVADDILLSKRTALLEEAVRNDPGDEAAVRFALSLDPNHTPEDESIQGRESSQSGGSRSSSRSSADRRSDSGQAAK